MKTLTKVLESMLTDTNATLWTGPASQDVVARPVPASEMGPTSSWGWGW